MNIPPQAVEAAAEAQNPGLFTLSDHRYGIEYDNPIEYRKLHQSDALEQARSVLAAALPHIEADLRAQIAADIRDEMNRPERIEMADRYEGYFQGQRSGLETAARIAEEGTTK